MNIHRDKSVNDLERQFVLTGPRCTCRPNICDSLYVRNLISYGKYFYKVPVTQIYYLEPSFHCPLLNERV